jgi:antitoxin component YwqK of YwqJK toxin-antitoxin module
MRYKILLGLVALFHIMFGVSLLLAEDAKLKKPDKIVERENITYFQYLYKTGEVRSEVPVRDGVPDGVMYNWFENGKVRYITVYHQGQIVSLSVFNPEGKLIKQGSYKNSLLEGYYLSFFPSGKIQYMQDFHEGKPVGAAQWFNEKGEVTLEHN